MAPQPGHRYPEQAAFYTKWPGYPENKTKKTTYSAHLCFKTPQCPLPLSIFQTAQRVGITTGLHSAFRMLRFLFLPKRAKLFSFLFRGEGRQTPVGQGLLISEVPRSHTRHTTDGRTPLDEWSALCRDLHLTTHTQNSQETNIDSNRKSQETRGCRPTP